MEENILTKSIVSIAVPIGYSLLFNPFSNCRVLMQLGYEPEPTYLDYLWFPYFRLGPKVNNLPSIIKYSKKVAEQIGWSGLALTGFPAKICYTYLSSTVTDAVYCHITKDDEDNNKSKMTLLDTDKPLKEFVGEVSILVGARLSGIIISYPIEVIMLRQVTQLLDGSSLSMLSWFSKILNEEGISGFYGGVSSKIVGELICLSAAATLLYGINNYLLTKVNNDDFKEYLPSVVNIITSPLAYKYSVISTLLAVSGSGLAYAIPFKGFGDAYNYLKRNKGFNRGSSFFFRYVR